MTCVDLTRSPLDEAAVAAADLVAFHVPMHTATASPSIWVPEEDAPLKADMYWVGGEVTCIQVTQRGIPNHAWGTWRVQVIESDRRR